MGHGYWGRGESDILLEFSVVKTKALQTLQTPGDLETGLPRGLSRCWSRSLKGFCRRITWAYGPNIPVPGPVPQWRLLVQVQPQALTDTHLVPCASQTCFCTPVLC